MIIKSEKYVKLFLHHLKKQFNIPSNIDYYLAGGALLSVFLGKDYGIKDYDLFGYTDTDVSKLACHFEMTRSLLIETANAYTFDSYKGTYGPYLQVIKRRIGYPLDVINSFDLTICAVAYDFNKEIFYYNKDWHDDIKHNNLRLCNETVLAQRSFSRIRKYENKHFIRRFNLKEVCNSCTNKVACLTSGEKICNKETES